MGVNVATPSFGGRYEPKYLSLSGSLVRPGEGPARSQFRTRPGALARASATAATGCSRLRRCTRAFHTVLLQNGYTYSSRKRPVAFAACLCSQRRVEARGILSAVRSKSSFGLIEERCADYSCSFTLEAVSQLDRDASITLATIREWKNSFACINRIPVDILSLIPTHLSSQKDRFYAASVCRHWREVLLKHGALWSQLFLRRGEDYVSTLLARAKGSALEVIAHLKAPVGTTTLISPHAQQIKSLEFIQNHWQDITTFSKFNSGQFPLLRTLKIISPQTPDSDGQLNVATPPSFLFRSSVNLKNFDFSFSKLSFLSHFVFPNLTTFELSSYPVGEYSALYLLNFLKASSTLRTVRVKVTSTVMLWDVPHKMAVVLPNVETFSLHVTCDPMKHVYDIAAHISCPRARQISLTHEMLDTDWSTGMDVFPTPVSWNTIVHQYSASPIEEVALEIDPEHEYTECSLTFQSSEATVVELGFEVNGTDLGEELDIPSAEIDRETFCQALKTIRDHPLVSHVKRLRIEYRAALSSGYEMLRMAGEVRDLFNSLGPLDKLAISGCDLHIFLATFLDEPALKQPIVFPQIKDLAIFHPEMDVDEMECMGAIVELAKSQHTLGIPFERVTVRMWSLPVGMAEELGRWVSAVDLHEEWYWEEQDM